jgi:uncharacterized repeat protein (TIGR01451 family)
MDDKYGAVTLGTNTLGPGNSTGGTLTHLVTESEIPKVINNATVTGNYSGGTVTDNDSCTIDIAFTPGIDINKTASITGSCPGTDPLSVSIGDTVTYCFNVTNTGEVTVTNITVIDDVYGTVLLGHTTLGPGNSTGGTKTHLVTESDIPKVINNVTITGNYSEGTVTDTDSCTINIAYAPGIDINKTASITRSCPGTDPLSVSIGDNVTYCFNVTNTGEVTVTNITVTDDKYGPVTLGTTTLGPGNSTGGTKTHLVTESDIPKVINNATVTGTDPLNGTVTDTDSCTIDIAFTPGIDINKTASTTGSCPGTDPLSVSIGDTVTYCFNVTNTGEVTVTNITVIDNVYGTVLLGHTTLGPRNSTGGTLTHLVTESDIPKVINNVTITGNYSEGTVTDTDSCTIDIAFAPGIDINKTASITGSCPGTDPLSVSIGDNVTYCFNVTNTGSETLTNITVTDDKYGPVTLGTNTLEPGNSTGGTITHLVNASDGSRVTNNVTVTGTDPLNETVTDTDSCTINTGIAAGIEIEKTASITGSCPGTNSLLVHIGDTVTYCFNVTNTGDVTVTNITVTDDKYGPGAVLNTTLGPGETTSGTTTYIVTESDIPQVINNVTITGTDTLNETVTDTDTCTITIAYALGLNIEKTASITGSCPGTNPLLVSIGDTVTYCFNVTNTGDVTVTNITVTDDKYGPVAVLNTTLGPGETTSGTTTYIVTESDIPQVINNVTITGIDPRGDTVSDTESCTVNIELQLGIDVNKTADPTAARAGTDVTFTLNVTNTGDCTLNPVRVEDTLPAGMSYVASKPEANETVGTLT